MYERIQDALKDDGPIPNDATFPGFDGNYETNLCGYARFLLENGYWSHVVGSTNDFPNSHGLQRDYRAMLNRFREIASDGHGLSLSADEARTLLDPKWVIIQTDW